MQNKHISRRSFLLSGTGIALGATMLGAAASSRADEALRRVATFKCDVTPPLGTPIYSSYKGLETIETPLLAKGVILEQGSQRWVLCAVDYCEINNSTHTLFQKRLADAVSAPIENVAVQTVHQHTAPMADADANRILEQMQTPLPPYPATSTFTDPAEKIFEAAAKAVAKLTPFNQVGTSQAKIERVASSRRVPTGDGKVESRMSSCTVQKLSDAPEGLIDPFLKTITFALDGKPLVRMHYYATHPQSFYGDPRASYDFVGMARERLEQQETVFQVYFTGCSGDIAAGKYNNRTPEAREGLYQRILAGMEASIAATQYVPAGDIRWTTAPLVLQPREDAGFSEAECRAQMADEKAPSSVRIGGAMTLAWRQRAAEPVTLSALHIGDVSVLHLSGEPMIAFQLHAQQTAPKRFVAVAGYGDCAMGYICLRSAFPEGGYEPTASNSTPDSEDALRAAINALLAGAA